MSSKFGQSDRPESPERQGVRRGLERARGLGLRSHEISELGALETKLREISRAFGVGPGTLALVAELLTPAEVLRIDQGEPQLTMTEVRSIFDPMRIIFDGLVRR